MFALIDWDFIYTIVLASIAIVLTYWALVVAVAIVWMIDRAIGKLREATKRENEKAKKDASAPSTNGSQNEYDSRIGLTAD